MKTFTAICNNNGCQFLRDGLKKKQAEQQATSHMNLYGHDVSIVEHPEPVVERIDYTPELTILNTKFLAHGLGLKYLECIRSHTGELIAKMWHRDMPKAAEIVVVF